MDFAKSLKIVSSLLLIVTSSMSIDAYLRNKQKAEQARRNRLRAQGFDSVKVAFSSLHHFR